MDIERGIEGEEIIRYGPAVQWPKGEEQEEPPDEDAMGGEHVYGMAVQTPSRPAKTVQGAFQEQDVSTLSVKAVRVLVMAAVRPGTLDRYEEQEKATKNEQFPGGRASVFDAITKRRNALEKLAQAEAA